MANIGSLTASLQLESAAFIRDLTKASQATAQASTRMQRDMAARSQVRFNERGEGGRPSLILGGLLKLSV
jgi:hypothetical protein